MENYLLSIDLGTSGMKCSVFDSDGRLAAHSTRSYETRYSEDGGAEQSPEDWYAALAACTSEIAGKNPGMLPQLAAVAVSGQMMGVVSIDSAGRVLAPAMIHADVRAGGDPEIFPWESRGDDFHMVYQRSGHRPSPSYSGAKIAWIRRHRKDIYSATDCFLNPKDYLNFRLTGELYTDVSDASGTLLYNLRKRDWDPELAALFGVDLTLLPPVLASHSMVGTVSRSAARDTGLPAGLPVAAGAGDGICAGIGAGSIRPGVTYNYIGTTAWVATTVDEPLDDPESRVFTFAHAVEGLYHSMGTMQTAGASIKWLREELFSNYHSDDLAYRAMDKILSESEPGSHGVIFLPYFMGERSPWWHNGLRAGWLGLSISSGLADQVRAVYEGVSNNLAMIAEALEQFAPFDELSLLGGGGLSEPWSRILCDAFGKPLTVHRDSVSVTARGAAVIAGVAAGMYSGYEAAEDLVETERSYEPDPDNSAVLARSREEMAAMVRRLYFS